MTRLSREEILRYSRHFNLSQIGLAGQKRLKASSVLLIGAGGLGSPMALYLAAAGVGRIGMVDFDVVDESNLHRQVLHGQADVGRSKLASATDRLYQVNPHIRVECHETRLTSENALSLFKQYDVVADGADNFATRYLTNDAAFFSGKPLVSGSVLGFEGQLSVFHHEGGPCYRCLFPEPPPPGSVPNCADGGVFGVLPGVVGSLQATEVLKLLMGIGQVAAGKLLLYDALACNFTSLSLAKDPDCALCGEQPTIHKLMDYEAFCGVEKKPMVAEITVTEAAQSLESYCLVDVRKGFEREICHIEPSLHIPLDSDDHAWREIPKNRPIITYCKTGLRSRKAAEKIKTLVDTEVFSLTGGMMQWINLIEPKKFKY